MDVFELRDQVTHDYARYMQSFIEIRDPAVAQRVNTSLPDLWPDPLIQLNPAFELGESMDELIAGGLLHEACRDIFATKSDGVRRPLALYRHQVEGIRAARAGANYVLTTGTGSGKSLSYIVPIVDHVLRTPRAQRVGIQAIVVYPMNALANSQRGELEKYLGTSARPVSFARYTGQDGEAERDMIIANPPDILLTNYVMLELILTRNNEKKLIAAAEGLRFLVFDELHTYRGRQGADVAMLCRRVREACKATKLIHIGTSATLASEGDWQRQQQRVAEVASQIFGVPVEPCRVIGETLRRATPELDFDELDTISRLQRRIERPAPDTVEAFIADPLASWIESALGLQLRDGRLVRQKPRSLSVIAGELAALVGRDRASCQDAIRNTLMASYPLSPRPIFAFRLHQFIAKGDTVYASLAPTGDRHLTTQSQRFVPNSDREQVLLPLCFCRECGQDFYTVRRGLNKTGGIAYISRDIGDQQETADGEAGFLYQSLERPWPRAKDEVLTTVPESWLEEHGGKLRVRRDRQERLPNIVSISADGVEAQAGLEFAYFRAPFMFCPTCGITYSARQRSDFGKLGTLGSEGRSTATTILSLATLRNLGGLPGNARKLLSFTDNRQDAALQAGHFNDFVSLGLIRTALFRALERNEHGINHDTLTQYVFDALDLPMRVYAANPEVMFGQRERTQCALRRVLGYYLYRDLARGWRLTSPNLEQCGLLDVEYRDLARFCAENQHWAGHSLLLSASSELRLAICTTLLNHLRRELAIFVEYLEPAAQEQVRLDANQLLIEPWRLLDGERLSQSFVAIIGRGSARKGKPLAGGRFMFVSPRGGFGQYLRRRNVLGGHGKLSLDETQSIIEYIATALEQGLGALRKVDVVHRGGKTIGYQVSAAAMIWRSGNGDRAAHDPIRVPQAPAVGLRANEFFRAFYREDARDLARLQAHEHTAQVRAKIREEREADFGTGKLPLLFCSPTMELGVDIAELNIVNMRNVPPTPANYAQRSGRAGRGGQPAFVFTYCTAHSPHDHYFFRHPELMVSGQVETPPIDLTNEDLLRAHVHAIWLAEAELSLGSSLSHVLDISSEPPSLAPKRYVEAALHDRGARVRAHRGAWAALGAEILALHDGDQAASMRWLGSALETIPRSFSLACERWRSLFLAAHNQARQQQQVLEDRSRPGSERQQARRLRDEAERQLDLLVDHGEGFNSDFYSYRYFASEGFLPGYNFPRLPLSAYLDSRQPRGRKDDDFLSRPRFLAVSEFGPRSIIYHEGERYVISKVILGGGLDRRDGDDGLLDRAASCERCGAIEPVLGETAPDLCGECGAALGPPTPNFFRMRNVVARRRDRITSDEEERLRIGYELRTGVHFPVIDGRKRRKIATLRDAEGRDLARLTYGHGANVWRINLGWNRRRRDDPLGFLLDLERGIWVKSQNPEDPDEEPDEPSSPRQERVIPYVEDTRNCLIIEPARELSDKQMASLQAALKTAIQLEFQIEDRELAAEPLPSRQNRKRLLFYEAAEGGAGVLRRLLDDRGDGNQRCAIDRVINRALELCHFDPDDARDLERAAPDRDPCEAACYDCLLSYFNQPDHGLVDRKFIPNLLLPWRGVSLDFSPEPKPREEHLDTLLSICKSDLDRRWLRFLAANGYNLPNRTQVVLLAGSARADFLYEPDMCSPVPVFIDGPAHDNHHVARHDRLVQEQLEDAGYLVLRFHHRARWEDVVARYPSIFGPGSTCAPTTAPSELTDGGELDTLLELFEPNWRAAVRRLAAHPRLTIEAGGELGTRVSATYLASIRFDDHTLYIIDAAEPDAQLAQEILQGRGHRVLRLRAEDPDPLTTVLHVLGAAK